MIDDKSNQQRGQLTNDSQLNQLKQLSGQPQQMHYGNQLEQLVQQKQQEQSFISVNRTDGEPFFGIDRTASARLEEREGRTFAASVAFDKVDLENHDLLKQAYTALLQQAEEWREELMRYRKDREAAMRAAIEHSSKDLHGRLINEWYGVDKEKKQ